MKTLTGARKMMNMQKLGTVSVFGSDSHYGTLFKVINKLRITCYTLCVIKI
jgi:hypothetical protein